MKRVIIPVAAALVAGCLSSAPREADRYFILEAEPRPQAVRQSTLAIRVAPTTVSSFYDTQDIVYSREPGARAYYQFNHWTERPQRSVRTQLTSRFESDGREGRFILNTHLEEIYHDAAEPPGRARIALTAQLVDAASRKVLARAAFTYAAPATSFDAPGAVQGFRRALGALLDDVVGWVDTEATRKTTQPPRLRTR